MPDETFLEQELAGLRRSGTLRSLREIRGAPGPVAQIGSRQALMLCSNNYLGLADDPRLKHAAWRAVERYGAGATGSRLIAGNNELYPQLESAVAALKGTPAALVFSSGYHANLGVITALAGTGDVIFSDQLNHASIIDGCRLSRAENLIYRHNDVKHLEELLTSRPAARRKLVITESVFSMDGDMAPLERLASLCREQGAMLMVDEAHATGVAGTNGAGLVEALGLTSEVSIQVGTFSKALGSLGGYVAGSRTLIEYLLNRARSFIFTTGLPPAVLGASLEAVGMVRTEPERRHRLLRHAARLRAGLRDIGFRLGLSESQIIPVILGDPRRTMAACRYLLQRGVFVQGIRPPTVADGSARLRLTPMATHSEAQIDEALDAFARLARLLQSPRRRAL